MIIHKDYCSRCKAKGIPLMKYSLKDNHQYYYCRKCNLERQKRYYHTPKGKRRIYISHLKSTAKHRERQKARQGLGYALNKGWITKPSICSQCETSGRIEGHHQDYTRALEVVWLCPPCHSLQHKVK